MSQLFEALAVNPDPEYRRNRVYWSVQLATAALRRGDVDKASHLALEALSAVASLRSKWIATRFASLRHDLGGQATRSTAARWFVTTYDEAARA